VTHRHQDGYMIGVLATNARGISEYTFARYRLSHDVALALFYDLQRRYPNAGGEDYAFGGRGWLPTAQVAQVAA
jgi:hypothetical protein